MHIKLDNSERVTLVAGCVLAGSRGHYLTRDFVEFAAELGYSVPDEDRVALDAYPYLEEAGLDPESVSWAFESAEAWFEDRLHGGILVQDGDISLYETEDCPECGETRFSDPDSEDNDCSEHLPMF